MTLGDRAREMSAQTISSQIPPRCLQDGVIVHRNHSLAGGWVLQLPNTALASNEARVALSAGMRVLLNTLPPNFEWQFRWVQHSRTAEMVETLSKRPRPDGLAGEILRETEELTVGLLATQQLSWKEGHLFLVRRPSDVEVSTPPGASSAGAVGRALQRVGGWVRRLAPRSASEDAQMSIEAHMAALDEVNLLMGSIEPHLKSMGLMPVRISNERATRILFEWANKDAYRAGVQSPKPDPFSGIPLSEVCAVTEFDRYDRGDKPLARGVFRMGDSYQAILTLVMPPALIESLMWQRPLYSGLARCELTVWGTQADRRKRIERLKRMLNAAKNKNVDKKTGREVSPEERGRIAALESEIVDLGGGDGAGTDLLWRVFATFRVWGDSEREVNEAVHHVQAACSSAGGIQVVHERHSPWSFLRATCPGWTCDQDPSRAIEVTSRVASRMLPMSGQPTCLRMQPDAVGALFPTETQSILNIDPHERMLYSAPHFMITAGTGKGKSVLVASILLELLGSDGRAVLVDRGNSFGGLATAFGVKPILMSASNRAICLNPLYVARGTVVDSEVVDSRIAILEVMLMSSAQEEGRLPGESRQLLRDTLTRLYEAKPGEELTLSDLRDALSALGKGAWLARNITPWCSGGDYHSMFDGRNNVPLGGRLTVIDLGQDVAGQKESLNNVLTMLIISSVSQMTAHGGARRKYVIFDEAGILMRNPAQAEFLEYAYRTFRKTGVGVGALTQLAMDLSRIFSYAYLKFFLAQDDLADTRAAAEKDGFPEGAVERIARLETVPGEYGDFVVIQNTSTGKCAHVCRNWVTPLKYVMVTSDKSDTHEIARIEREESVDRAEAMRLFAARFPRGVEWARANRRTDSD